MDLLKLRHFNAFKQPRSVYLGIVVSPQKNGKKDLIL